MITDSQKKLMTVTLIFLIAIFFTYLWISGFFQTSMTILNNSSPGASHNYSDLNASPSKLPSGIKPDIEKVSQENFFVVNTWEFDPEKKDTIILFVIDIRNESAVADLQGMKIKNYTITLIHDSEFDKTQQEVSDYLWNLGKNPDYQINAVWMSVNRLNNLPENNAEVWVYKSTPENEKLDNTMIKGWRIRVYPVSSPPLTTQTPAINPSDISP